jgi:hypothetical protein
MMGEVVESELKCYTGWVMSVAFSKMAVELSLNQMTRQSGSGI